MKAVVYTRYGSPDVLRIADVETPVPKDGEVLVKVCAVSLNGSDWEVLRGKPLYSRIGGPFRPRRHILGSDIAGRVEAAGPGTTLLRVGDDVFADAFSHLGGFAEYVCLPESVLARMPAGMTHEEAAALPQAGVIALQGILDKGRVQPGDKVLINGEKLEFMRRLGADYVIDYTREDFTRNGRTYDVILDLAAHRSVFAYRGSLSPGGRYLYVGGSVATLLQTLLLGPLIGRARDKKLRLLVVRQGVQNVAQLVELCQAGKVATHIDRRYSLTDAPEAMRYFGKGHAKGKVVVIAD